MHISKPNKAVLMRELKDYVMITLGLISYSLAWAAFLIPYQITTGGTTGIGAIIYYATGFPIQWSYFLINAVLMQDDLCHLYVDILSVVVPEDCERS